MMARLGRAIKFQTEILSAQYRELLSELRRVDALGKKAWIISDPDFATEECPIRICVETAQNPGTDVLGILGRFRFMPV